VDFPGLLCGRGDALDSRIAELQKTNPSPPPKN